MSLPKNFKVSIDLSFLRQPSGQPKISQSWVTIFVKKHISRIQVIKHDLVVKTLRKENSNEASNIKPYWFFIKHLFLLESGKEVSSAAVLHSVSEVLRILNFLDPLNYERMLHRIEKHGFIMPLPHFSFPLQFALIDHFHDKSPVQKSMPYQIDCALSSLPNLPHQL